MQVEIQNGAHTFEDGMNALDIAKQVYKELY